jgi:hypothetical protein
VSGAHVIDLTEWFGRVARKREQRAVTPEEGWRLHRAFRRIADPKRREEIIALVERSSPTSPDLPTAG